MRKLFGLVVGVLALACSLSASAQTTYTQTNHVCLLYQCKGATFTPPALLSYQLPEVFNALNRGETNITFTNQYTQWCTGSLTCTQVSYEDFNGTLVRTTHGTDPNCPISDACWYLNGTFNSGNETVAKKFECFARGCTSGANDTSGSVVASGSAKLKPGTCWWDGKGASSKNIRCATATGPSYIVLSDRLNVCTDDGKVWWRQRQDGMCHAADNPGRQ